MMDSLTHIHRPFSISQENLVGTRVDHCLSAVSIHIVSGYARRGFWELPLATRVSPVRGLRYLKDACMVIQYVFMLVSYQNNWFHLLKRSVLPIAPLSLEIPTFLSIRNRNHTQWPSPETTRDSSV
jgi:hypothetical protein